MRHGKKIKKLGRVASHRRAMNRNQLAALFRHGRIRTTLPKAKALRPLAEKMITLAGRTGTDAQILHARRQAIAKVGDVPAVRALFDDIGPRFRERPGGYTRILKLGRRKGDNAPMALLEFVDYEFVARENRDED